MFCRQESPRPKVWTLTEGSCNLSLVTEWHQATNQSSDGDSVTNGSRALRVTRDRALVSHLRWVARWIEATKITGTEKISHFPLIIQIRSSEYFNLGWHIFSLSVSYDAAGRLHQKKVDGGWDGRGFQSVSELTFGISWFILGLCRAINQSRLIISLTCHN